MLYQSFQRSSLTLVSHHSLSKLVLASLFLASTVGGTILVAQRSQAYNVSLTTGAAEMLDTSQNALPLRTGQILVVRHEGKYGAVQAVDQSTKSRGAFIRYVWWYQPDGSGSFLKNNALTGFGETRESYTGPSPVLKIGPIELEWSIGREGQGWVYFRHLNKRKIIYELVATKKIDITTIDVSELDFKQ